MFAAFKAVIAEVVPWMIVIAIVAAILAASGLPVECWDAPNPQACKMDGD